jgi:hypothetical protein
MATSELAGRSAIATGRRELNGLTVPRGRVARSSAAFISIAHEQEQRALCCFNRVEHVSGHAGLNLLFVCPVPASPFPRSLPPSDVLSAIADAQSIGHQLARDAGVRLKLLFETLL